MYLLYRERMINERIPSKMPTKKQLIKVKHYLVRRITKYIPSIPFDASPLFINRFLELLKNEPKHLRFLMTCKSSTSKRILKECRELLTRVRHFDQCFETSSRIHSHLNNMKSIYLHPLSKDEHVHLPSHGHTFPKNINYTSLLHWLTCFEEFTFKDDGDSKDSTLNQSACNTLLNSSSDLPSVDINESFQLEKDGFLDAAKNNVKRVSCPSCVASCDHSLPRSMLLHSYHQKLLNRILDHFPKYRPCY